MILQPPKALGDIQKPVRSRITERLAILLSAVAPVEIGVKRGYSEEAPMIYLTPGRESVDRQYGSEQRESDYVVLVMVDASQYAIPEYEIVDRLIAQVSSAMATRDAVLEAACNGIRLTSTRPGYREDQGNLIGAELSYTVSYAADPADPETAI